MDVLVGYFCKSHCPQIGVSLFQICINFLIIYNFLVLQVDQFSFLAFFSR